MRCEKISHKKIAKNIRRFGWHGLQVIDPIGGTWAFEYTIGNHEKGLPEVLIIGCIDAKLLHDVCTRMQAENRAFEQGELINAGCRYPFKAINASNEAHKEYTIQVGEYYKTQNYRVQQILLPDTSGRYSDDPLCAKPHSLMPVLADKASGSGLYLGSNATSSLGVDTSMKH